MTVPPSVTVAAGQPTAPFPRHDSDQGQATITASFNSTSATAQVVVTAPRWSRSRSRPPPDGRFAGELIAFTATGNTDGSSQPLVNDVTWTSTNQSSRASIGSSGLAAAFDRPTTTIRATVTTSVGLGHWRDDAHGATRAGIGGDATHDVADGRPERVVHCQGRRGSSSALTVIAAVRQRHLLEPCLGGHLGRTNHLAHAGASHPRRGSAR